MTRAEIQREFKGQPQKELKGEALETWRYILTLHGSYKKEKIYELFEQGVDALGLTPNIAPDIYEVNKRLQKLTGFQGVFVEGLEGAQAFFPMLSQRLFPIGNFIREKSDVSYTPAPDIIHDLYGHLPFLANSRYADFCQKYGELSCEFLNDANRMRQLERFFWFTIEFGLICTREGIKVFGAGIASSLAECDYALSDRPRVLPFDIDAIRHQEFKIDEMQKVLFLLQNVEQLYDSLPELFKRVKAG